MKYLITLVVLMLPVPGFGSWARVHTTNAYCGDSVSSCSLTVPSPTAGNLLAVAMAYNGSSINISSVTGLGSWVHPTGCQANISGYQAVDWAYNLSASTGTSITVTMSGTAEYADVYYFEYSGSGPFTFDTCGVVSGGATLSPASGGVSTSGINDLGLSIVKVDQTLSNSVSPSPWTSTVYVLNSNEAVDDALNFGATSTEPIFSATSASYYAGSTIAFEDTNIAQQIYDDMTGSHEAEPHGVPCPSGKCA